MFKGDAADANIRNTPQKTRVEERDGGLVAARAAAAMLERAARLHLFRLSGLPEDEESGRLRLYLESVGDLAGGIRRDLEALSEESGDPHLLVGAALRGADLATLAACAMPELPPESPAYLLFEASTRLSSAATKSLSLEYEALFLSVPRGDSGGYEARDLRGAEWRASLAVKQVDDMSRGES